MKQMRQEKAQNCHAFAFCEVAAEVFLFTSSFYQENREIYQNEENIARIRNKIPTEKSL